MCQSIAVCSDIDFTYLATEWDLIATVLVSVGVCRYEHLSLGCVEARHLLHDRWLHVRI